MSEQSGSTTIPASGQTPPGGQSLQRTSGGGGEKSSALQTEKGTTKIADGVVAKVAGIAAREVPGVHALGGGASRALSGVAQRVGVGEQKSQGVSVEVGEVEAAVDLTIVVEYGESIPTVADAIRENVIRRIEGTCGLSVTEVNIAVNDLFFPGEEEPEQPARVA